VQDGERPVLLVTHDEDADWSFLCGDVHPQDAAFFRVDGFVHPISNDPTLAEVLDLPVGEQVERRHPGRPWVRSPMEV
jgi:hypothetical protein